jgi:hypothetical protein
MSITIKSIFDMEWTIAKPTSEGTGQPEVAIDTMGNKGNRIFKVADVLDAMKAEGVLDAVEIITELPEVKPDNLAGWVIAGGITMSTKDGAEWHRKLGLNHLAVANHLEGERALADLAKKLEASKADALKQRRDTLANQLIHHDKPGYSTAFWGYDKVTPLVQSAVDHIIALEDQLAAK